MKLDRPEEQVYKLEQPGMVRGRVVDGATGKPVTKFRAWLDFCEIRQPGDPDRIHAYHGRWFRSAATFEAKDGRFTIDQLGYRYPVQLVVEADGYERNVVPRVVPLHADQAAELKIVLLPIKSSDYSSVRGQLLDSKGKAIAGVQMRLLVTTQPPGGRETNWRMFEWLVRSHSGWPPPVERFDSALTDGNGRFEFSKILSGRYVYLFYWANEVPKSRWSSWEPTRPGKDTSIVINVPKPAKIRGTIDRTKLADASEISIGPKNDHSLSFSIDLRAKQSTFEFHDLAPGEYWFELVGNPRTLKDNGRLYAAVTRLEFGSLHVDAGETKELHFAEPQKKR
jgi:hypothetical protein